VVFAMFAKVNAPLMPGCEAGRAAPLQASPISLRPRLGTSGKGPRMAASERKSARK